jgi:DNA-binding MarR family transcriptional regulator
MESEISTLILLIGLPPNELREGIKLARLAFEMNVHVNTVKLHLNKLSERGLITKQRPRLSGADARTLSITIPAKAHDVLLREYGVIVPTNRPNALAATV